MCRINIKKRGGYIDTTKDDIEAWIKIIESYK